MSLPSFNRDVEAAIAASGLRDAAAIVGRKAGGMGPDRVDVRIGALIVSFGDDRGNLLVGCAPAGMQWLRVPLAFLIGAREGHGVPTSLASVPAALQQIEMAMPGIERRSRVPICFLTYWRAGRRWKRYNEKRFGV